MCGGRAQSKTRWACGELLSLSARLGLRREAKRHAAFVRTKALDGSWASSRGRKRRRRCALPAQSKTLARSRGAVRASRRVVDCGGKRSATPLSCARQALGGSWASRAGESAVAAALCRRSPRHAARLRRSHSPRAASWTAAGSEAPRRLRAHEGSGWFVGVSRARKRRRRCALPGVKRRSPRHVGRASREASRQRLGLRREAKRHAAFGAGRGFGVVRGRSVRAKAPSPLRSAGHSQ